MKKVIHSLWVAMAVAVLFTWFRGGIADAPWIALVFAAIGFAASMTVFAQPWMDKLLGWSSTARIVRNLAAVACLVVILFSSGQVVASAGYAGWLVLFLLSFFGSSIVSTLATEWPIALGIVSATCLTLSLWWDNLRATSSGVPVMPLEVAEITWLLASALSCGATIPLHYARRRLRKIHP